MSKRRLNVGAIVHLRHLASARTDAEVFRIEQLVRLEEGGTLYKVKSDAEPFDRVVTEHDLAIQG